MNIEVVHPFETSVNLFTLQGIISQETAIFRMKAGEVVEMPAEPESKICHFAGDGNPSSRQIKKHGVKGSDVILHYNESKHCDIWDVKVSILVSDTDYPDKGFCGILQCPRQM
jgi:hypothetical protein